MAGRGRGMALTRPAWMRHPAPAPAAAPSIPVSPAAPVSDWARAAAADGRPYWYSLSSGATTWDDPTAVPTLPASAPVPALPARSPWRETRTEDGRSYYYNVDTKQTQWDRPPDMPQNPPPAHSPSPRPRDHRPHHHQPQQQPQLPDGWAQNAAPDGRLYYYHAATRETRWERPTSSAQPRLAPAPVSTPSNLPVADAQLALPDGWKEHTAPDGRVYYYNTATSETSWTRPPHPPSLESKRPRAPAATSPPVADLRQALSKSRKLRSTDQVRPDKKGDRAVRRPRSQDGNTLTDHQAETYFLNRAKIRKKASSMEDGDSDQGKQPQFMELDTHAQRQQSFYDLLRDRGIDEHSTWLETMSRCVDDPRYIALKPYGERKNSWLKWTQKCKKQSRRKAVVATRNKSEALISLMDELFANEPLSSSTLERCKPETVKAFEGDERFRAVDERTRSGLVKAFFGIRARNGERDRVQKRKECLARMRATLDEMVNPAILPTKGKNRVKDEKMADVSDGKEKANGEYGTNGTGTSERTEKVFFSDRTPFRELDRFLSSIPGSEAVDSSDRAGIIRDWRRVVERLVHEKKAREREARKALQKERRARFRSGIEKMILDGRISIMSRWKEVADIVVKESFAVPEDDLDAHPADLYQDAQVLFEDRVESHREDFKRFIRDENIEIQDTTTVEDLQKAESLDKFIKGLERPVVDALLADRQRKESKKRQKELRGAMADFEKLLHRSEISSDSTFETVTELWKDRTAFKHLDALAGSGAVRKVYDEFMQRLRSREAKAREHQARQKRKFEEPAAPPPFDHEALATLERAKRIRLPGLPGGPVQSVPISYRAPPVEEESGWAAALSSKPMTEQEKLAAKERRKRELLEGLGSQGS